MIETFFSSIAGHKTNDTINLLIEGFLSSEYVPNQEKKILRNSLEVAQHGNYPSAEYYATFYEPSEVTYNSLAEIKAYCAKVLDFYKKQYIQGQMIIAMNETETSQELLERIQSLSDSPSSSSTDLSEYKPNLYTQESHDHVKGIYSGVKEVDDVTFTFQPGTVVGVCGFVSHGKTTFTDSIIFKNVMEKRRGLLISLEMSPDLIWPQFEARYLNQVKNIQVTAKDLIFHKVASDLLPEIEAAEKEFMEEFAKYLVIVDEGFIDKQTMLNPRALASKIKVVEEQLGGLDFFAWDHVTQLALMFPDCGNSMIKTIQVVAKTYKDRNGVKPVGLIAVQANREGEKRARKRNGVYDMQAISELNEVERTCTYILFIYTSDDMKIMQETKITMPKHRLGSPITEPIVTTFNPAIITVGQSVETVEMSDNDFNNLNLDLGSDFDDFG